MATTNEVVLLRVQLDEGKTTDQLKKLVLDIEQTKAAQAALNQARKQGAVTDEAYAAENVRLTQQLKAQRQEQTALSKNLELYSAATKGLTDSYQAQQAQLSLAQRQYQQLAGSASNSTEETQALASVIDELRGTLKTTDAGMGLFVRSVGNYQGAVEPLIAELKRLELQQKELGKDDPAYKEQQKRIVGFQQAINKAGAEAGLSYEQTQAKLESYGAQIEPVVQELVKLEQQQEAVAEGSEQYNRIGFRIQGLKKSLTEVTPQARSVGGAMKEAALQTGLLGGVTETYTGIKARYTAVVGAARTATLAEAGALNILKVALIATGLGALLVVLGSVVVFLTKTSEGTKIVSNVMAQLGAVVNVVIDRLGAVGKAVTQVLSGEFTAAAQTAKGALSGIGDELSREVKLAGDLSRARQQLDRDTVNNIDTNKRLLNEVERLKNIRDNEFNTLEVRKKANEDAFKVEFERENTLADLARRRVALLKAEIDQRGGLRKVSLDQLKEFKEAQNELSDIQEDAAGKQNELITNRFQLSKEGLDKQKEAEKAAAEAAKAAAEKALAARQSELRVQLGLLDLALEQVEKNSEQELNILRRKLATQRRLELATKDLTVRQKQLIDAKYEAESLKLTVDSERQRAKAALEAERDTVAGELALATEGSQQRYELSRRALVLEAELQKAGLDVRANNAAKEYAIRAKLEADLAQLAKDNAAQEVERQRKALDEQANLLALGTDRQLLGLSQEQARRVALSEGYVNARKGAILAERDALVVGTQEGSAERLRIEQETAAAILDLDRQTTEGRKQLFSEQFAAIAGIVENSLSSLGSIQDAQKSQALNRDEAQLKQQLSAAGDNAEQREKIEKQHALNKERIEKEFAEKRRRIALAQAVIGLATGVMQILQAPAAPFVEPFASIVRGVQIGLLTATAGAQISAIKSQQFEQGGVLQGPSHAGGGVPLYHRTTGQHMGEAEGDEIIMTKGVWRSPLLRPLASVLNVLGGGKALVPSRYMALGGVTSSNLVRESVSGPAAVVDYAQLGEATAAALRAAPPRVVVQDVKDGLSRAAFTDGMANS